MKYPKCHLCKCEIKGMVYADFYLFTDAIYFPPQGTQYIHCLEHHLCFGSQFYGFTKEDINWTIKMNALEVESAP